MASDKPYRGVSAGGNIFDSAKVQYSPQTQNLLKTMMQESKLTNFQQRTLQESLRGGSSLPSSCHPTSSQYSAPVQKNTSSKSQPRRAETLSGMRTRDQIMARGDYDREKFKSQSNQTVDREKEKDRLAKRLAGLDNSMSPDDKRPTTLGEFEAQQKRVAEVQRQMELQQKNSKVKDRFEELWDEISDRREFLYNMEKLGQGKDYRQVIVTEISQKIREMEVIDMKRSKQLESELRKESMTLDSL